MNNRIDYYEFENGIEKKMQELLYQKKVILKKLYKDDISYEERDFLEYLLYKIKIELNQLDELYNPVVINEERKEQVKRKRGW